MGKQYQLFKKMVNINYELEFEVEVCESQEYAVPIQYEPEYNITPYIEYTPKETEPKFTTDYTIQTDSWEGWGENISVPAKGWYDQFGQKNAVFFHDFRKLEC